MTHLNDLVLQPVQFRKLTTKNRVWRASLSNWRDRADLCNQGMEWELKWARAGVGAIISPLVSVMPDTGAVPDCASIHRDGALSLWRELVARIHGYDCRYLLRLGHLGGPGAPSLPPDELAWRFAEAALRARETGADGIEIDGNLGARELLVYQLSYITSAVRAAVGRAFHIQVSLDGSAPGALQLARRLQEATIDAVHVSTGASFPSPRDPAEAGPLLVEVSNVGSARRLRQALQIPILCNGRFHDAVFAREAIESGACDVVTLARPLVGPVAGTRLLPVRARLPASTRRPSGPRRALPPHALGGGNSRVPS